MRGNMDTVNVLLCASFFAPLPEPWQRVCLFGFGLAFYGAYNCFTVYSSENLLFWKSFMFTARTCMLLVLLSSWIWSDVAIPKFVESDELLLRIHQALPRDLSFVINASSSSLTVYGFNETLVPDRVEIALDRSLLDSFRLEMPQTPIVDWIPSLRTMGGYYEIWYKVLFGPWIQAVRSTTEPSKSLIEVTEFRLGDRVLSGGKRLGQPRRSGTVQMVYPSPLLDRFMYDVEWEPVDGAQSGERTKERASELVPASTKVYIYPRLFGPLNSSEEVPHDALAIFTSSNMTLLEGFSFYYNQYWRLHRTRPSELNGLLGGNRSKNLFIPRDGTEAICLVPQSTLPWTEIGPSQLEKWRPLFALGVLACSKQESGLWECSRDVAGRNLDRIREYLYPLIQRGVRDTESDQVSKRSLVQYYLWWSLFFMSQTTTLLVLSVLFVILTLAPMTYAMVNSLRNVEESGSTIGLVVHVSLRTYDFLSLSYHLAHAFKHFNMFNLYTGWYLRNGRTVILFHIVANCVMLLGMRRRNESEFDGERNRMLSMRARQMRIVGRQPHFESDLPSCRICFESEGELVSPCLCGGSMRFVHPECISEWRFRSLHSESFVRCDQCHYRYKLRTTWAGFILRSSLFISLISLVLMVLVMFAVSYVFKLVEVLIAGRGINDWALGPKVSHYIKHGAWNSQAMLQNPTEQAFVEQMTGFLGMMHLELGHLVCSIILLGYLAFLYNEHFTMPWVWTVSDDVPLEEGWPLYLGGKTAIVVCVGLYRLFSRIWHYVKSKRLKWFSAKETTLVNVEPAFEDVKAGTILKTPFGLVRVLRYRKDDDVLESEFQKWQPAFRSNGEFLSARAKRQAFRLFQSGADCVRFDRVVDVAAGCDNQ